MDDRIPLQNGFMISLGDTAYTIKALVGFGSSAFVYSASYRDNLQPDKTHAALIKELFPCYPKNLITRGKDGQVECHADAGGLFDDHKNSFLRGNGLHLDFANVRADMASVNINSYEMNGTVYTVISDSSGETLQAAAGRGEIVNSLSDVAMCMIRVLDALEVFHENDLLHLDISPDNILLMPAERGRRERRVMLIDYSSIWGIDDLREYKGAYFSVKENYSAPEVRLQDKGAVSRASDLFSVCAIFLEYLRGEPMNFAALYSGEKVVAEDTLLLKNVPDAAASKALAIVKKGLRLAPARRYQSTTELKIDFIELLSSLSRAKRKRRVVASIAGILLTAMCIGVALYSIDFHTSSYPKAQQEIYLVENAMTALSDGLGRLGRQMESDLTALEESIVPFAPNPAKPRNERYSDGYVRDMLGPRSPIPATVYTELLNAPDDYAAWSEGMRENLRAVLGSESIYPEDDRAEIVRLYAEYLERYANACYIKLQLTVLPLNDIGRRPILSALPYIPVFSQIFLTRPFVTDRAALESALEAENAKLRDISTGIISYGL